MDNSVMWDRECELVCHTYIQIDYKQPNTKLVRICDIGHDTFIRDTITGKKIKINNKSEYERVVFIRT